MYFILFNDCMVFHSAIDHSLTVFFLMDVYVYLKLSNYSCLVPFLDVYAGLKIPLTYDFILYNSACPYNIYR